MSDRQLSEVGSLASARELEAHNQPTSLYEQDVNASPLSLLSATLIYSSNFNEIWQLFSERINEDLEMDG